MSADKSRIAERLRNLAARWTHVTPGLQDAELFNQAADLLEAPTAATLCSYPECVRGGAHLPKGQCGDCHKEFARQLDHVAFNICTGGAKHSTEARMVTKAARLIESITPSAAIHTEPNAASQDRQIASASPTERGVNIDRPASAAPEWPRYDPFCWKCGAAAKRVEVRSTGGQR